MNMIEQLQQDYIRKQSEKGVKIKVGLIGQPGAGKSSLINRLVGEEVFEVGVHTDTTVDMQMRELEQMIVVDLPGYGTKQFPVDDWVAQFRPDELDLYLFVFSGKLRDADGVLFEYLKRWQTERNHPHFIVRNKSDEIWDDDRSDEELRAEIIYDVNSKMRSRGSRTYFTSCRTGEGLAELQEAILSSDIDGVKKSKLIYEFKARSIADLDRKRELCRGDLNYYGITAAANALNPIPGVDVSVDIGVMLKMFADFRAAFQLNDDVEDKMKKYKIITPLANRVFSYATRAGVTKLVQSLGNKYAGKEAAKYLPLVGQAAAAAAGYLMVTSIGRAYINDCHELAAEILNQFAAQQ